VKFLLDTNVISEIRKRDRADPNVARWVARTPVEEIGTSPIDEPIADAWARLAIPDPLPLIDGLLAAAAKVHGLTLVTRNVADISPTGVVFLDPFSG
jgi:predicted nucleic acid-binding protein